VTEKNGLRLAIETKHGGCQDDAIGLQAMRDFGVTGGADDVGRIDGVPEFGEFRNEPPETCFAGAVL